MSIRKNSNSFEKAKQYCFLLLKYRLRTEHEIFDRLKRKGFGQEVIKKAIDFLKDKKFIDDEAFAQSWIESRVRQSVGLRRIKQELIRKGVAKKDIEAKIDSVKNNYSEDQAVKQIVQRKFEKFKGLDLYTAKRRVFAYLLRKGFNPDTISDALNELGRDES